MIFTTFYGAKHGDAVMEMLENYTDYTPFEKVQPDAKSSQSTFEDGHIQGSSGAFQFCGLDDEGKAMAFINVNKTDIKGPAWLIEELFVSKSADSNAVAKEMVDQLLQMLKDEDIKKIGSFVYPSFDGMLKFWEDLGFKEEPLIKQTNGSDERVIVLTKDI